MGGLIIKNQTVECAQNLSTAFSSGTGDGLLGLAFALLITVTGAPSPTLTPVQSLNQEGVTPPVFISLRTASNRRAMRCSHVNSLATMKIPASTPLVTSTMRHLINRFRSCRTGRKWPRCVLRSYNRRQRILENLFLQCCH